MLSSAGGDTSTAFNATKFVQLALPKEEASHSSSASACKCVPHVDSPV